MKIAWNRILNDFTMFLGLYCLKRRARKGPCSDMLKGNRSGRQRGNFNMGRRQTDTAIPNYI